MTSNHPLLSSLVGTLLLLGGGCSAPTISKPVLRSCHPACPGARTAVIADAGSGLRGAEPREVPDLDPIAEPLPSPAAYLCPMHLTIGSHEPARCPECNMKLLPREQVLEHPHED